MFHSFPAGVVVGETECGYLTVMPRAWLVCWLSKFMFIPIQMIDVRGQARC
jgi:hypothetical protein